MMSGQVGTCAKSDITAGVEKRERQKDRQPLLRERLDRERKKPSPILKRRRREIEREETENRDERKKRETKT